MLVEREQIAHQVTVALVLSHQFLAAQQQVWDNYQAATITLLAVAVQVQTQVEIEEEYFLYLNLYLNLFIAEEEQ